MSYKHDTSSYILRQHSKYNYIGSTELHEISLQGINVRAVARTGHSIGGKRGQITHFSAASHRRLMETFNKLEEQAIYNSWFGGLTYPDECLPNADSLKDDLHLLLVNWMQKYPKSSVIWKVELERRKSGKYIGQLVPHIHFLFVAQPEGLSVDEFDVWARSTWYRIVGSELKKHFENGFYVKPTYGDLRSRVWYATKYTGKYIAEDIANEYGWSGRFWGIRGRKNLPFAEEKNIVLVGRETVEYRRLICRYLEQRPSGVRVAQRIRERGLGYNAWGLSSSEAERMAIHAVQLARDYYENHQRVSLAFGKYGGFEREELLPHQVNYHLIEKVPKTCLSDGLDRIDLVGMLVRRGGVVERIKKRWMPKYKKAQRRVMKKESRRIQIAMQGSFSGEVARSALKAMGLPEPSWATRKHLDRVMREVKEVDIETALKVFD